MLRSCHTERRDAKYSSSNRAVRSRLPPATKPAIVACSRSLVSEVSARALRQASSSECLVVVDCLTLWLTNVLMPVAHGDEARGRSRPWPQLRADLMQALPTVPGPVVLVSNEVGWGVIPMGREVRDFVDELGRLNQDVAQCCDHVTLMAAGQPWTRAVERWA